MPPLYYPTSVSDGNELFYGMGFQYAPYSVLAVNRTRGAIASLSGDDRTIYLPLPSELVFAANHGWSENANPVGPMLSAAGLANSPGGESELIRRAFIDPMLMYVQNISSTTTQQSFSNITELSIISEARRDYNFTFNLIPKSQDDAIAIARIVTAFSVNSYPYYASVPERVTPPPLWNIFIATAGDVAENTCDLTRAWLGSPMVCILASVEANKMPITEQRATHFSSGQPVATSLTLVFKEFETAAVDARGRLVSKSEYASDSGVPTCL